MPTTSKTHEYQKELSDRERDKGDAWADCQDDHPEIIALEKTVETEDSFIFHTLEEV